MNDRVPIQFFVSEEEKAKIKEAAQGVGLSDYIREHLPQTSTARAKEELGRLVNAYVDRGEIPASDRTLVETQMKGLNEEQKLAKLTQHILVTYRLTRGQAEIFARDELASLTSET